MPTYLYRCPEHGLFERTRPMSRRDSTAHCSECGVDCERDRNAEFRSQVMGTDTGWHTNWSDILHPKAIGAAPFSEDKRRYGPDCGTRWT
jgi:putative FmdB family regulatory protein